MQRTDSIFFISGKQICGRESPGGSLNSLSQTRVTRNEIGEIYYWFTRTRFQDHFNALADKRNKTNAIEYQKERLDNRSLKNILVCSIAE